MIFENGKERFKLLNKAKLRRATYERKEWLIKVLKSYGYCQLHGRSLREASLYELEMKHIQIKCNIGKAMSREDF